MVYGCAIGSATWLWFRLNWAVRGNFWLACAMTPLLLSTGNIHWLARPHVFSWLLLLGTLLLVERGPRGFGPRDLLLAAAGGAVWANFHASFCAGPLIALTWSAGHLVRPLLWDADRAAEFRRARWLAAMAAAGALGSLLNPFGWNLHRHVFRYLSDSNLLSRIGEFQSFDFHAEGASQVLSALLVLAAGAAAALAGRRPEHAVLMLAVAAAALRSARVLPLVALLLPLANGAFTAGLRSASGLRPAVRRSIDAFLAYSDRLRALDAGGGGWALAWVVPALCFALLRTPSIAARTGFPPDQFPVAAAAQVEKLPPAARLFAPDKFGGYLIYRFAGRRKVFFDGRSDFYGAEFLKRYGRMAQVRPGWREIWDGFAFTHALLPNDYSLVPALEGIGWRRIYRDGTAILLAAPNVGQASRSVPDRPGGPSHRAAAELKDLPCVTTLYRSVPHRGSVHAGWPAPVSSA